MEQNKTRISTLWQRVPTWIDRQRWWAVLMVMLTQTKSIEQGGRTPQQLGEGQRIQMKWLRSPRPGTHYLSCLSCQTEHKCLLCLLVCVYICLVTCKQILLAFEQTFKHLLTARVSSASRRRQMFMPTRRRIFYCLHKQQQITNFGVFLNITWRYMFVCECVCLLL